MAAHKNAAPKMPERIIAVPRCYDTSPLLFGGTLTISFYRRKSLAASYSKRRLITLLSCCDMFASRSALGQKKTWATGTVSEKGFKTDIAAATTETDIP